MTGNYYPDHCTLNFSRRHLLKLGAGAAAMCAAGVGPAYLYAVAATKRIPLGVQLWSVQDEAAKDLASTLDALAKMGYQGVEFAGYYNQKPQDIRKMLDQSGLQCCGTHLQLKTCAGDGLKRNIENSHILGNKLHIVGAVEKDEMDSVQTAIKTAEVATEISEKLKPEGMRIGFHTEAFSPWNMGAQTIWDILFDHAGPAVTMELDTRSCMEAKVDPVSLLKKYPARQLTIHLVENGSKSAVIGEGDVPWKAVFDVCENLCHTRWYIAEQWYPEKGKSLEGVKRDLAALRKMGK
jgi:sugar phosphate isomerase/epimerase